jgi:tetraacyldisaccharide 4'-kinase
MRSAPAFWGEPAGIAANLLLPVGVVWDSIGRLRQALSLPYHAPVPVICIGNLVAGGAGKTPVALALATRLVDRGCDAHLVTRGYGGRLGGPLQVDPARHDAIAIGDEALLLAARAPCWVARDRAAGVRAAVAAGAEIVLLDDGFQNPAVRKTLSLLVVDAAYGFGNRQVIPAGPLRENLIRGLARAHGIVLLGAGAGYVDHPGFGTELPVFRAKLEPVRGERLKGSHLLAFAGIGRPEKFFASLKRLGAVLVGTRAFPDHHRYRAHQIAKLQREAEQAGASLVTTAKDIVRVPPAARAGIEVLEVEIRWDDPEAFWHLLAPIVRVADGDGRNSIAR